MAALLDRWWLGIHHGAIDADHLDYYLQAVQHEPVPYKGLVGGHRSLGNQM